MEAARLLVLAEGGVPPLGQLGALLNHHAGASILALNVLREHLKVRDAGTRGEQDLGSSVEEESLGFRQVRGYDDAPGLGPQAAQAVRVGVGASQVGHGVSGQILLGGVETVWVSRGNKEVSAVSGEEGVGEVKGGAAVQRDSVARASVKPASHQTAARVVDIATCVGTLCEFRKNDVAFLSSDLANCSNNIDVEAFYFTNIV